MTPHDARFILCAHRSDGRYRRDDPLFAEALAATARDPALAVWLEREQAVDSVVANKLDGIQPPAGLREAILAGARASRPRARRWSRPVWLAAAASIALALGIVSTISRSDTTFLTAAALTEFGLQDVAKDEHDHNNAPPAVLELYEELSAERRPVTAGFMPGFAEMEAKGCARFAVAGKAVFEVCFARDGKWFHVYAARVRPDGHHAPDAAAPAIVEHGRLAAVTWATGDTLYTVATNEGIDALRSIL